MLYNNCIFIYLCLSISLIFACDQKITQSKVDRLPNGINSPKKYHLREKRNSPEVEEINESKMPLLNHVVLNLTYYHAILRRHDPSSFIDHVAYSKNSNEAQWNYIMTKDSNSNIGIIKLFFNFPFYGNLINLVGLTTYGFLSMKPSLDSDINKISYIAPMMSSYSINNKAGKVYVSMTNSQLLVTWYNITLVNKTKDIGITFQCLLKKSGEIVFSYKTLSANFSSTENNDINKIGLSDGFVSTIFSLMHFHFHKSIVEYHNISIGRNHISNGTSITFLPYSTCAMLTTKIQCDNSDGHVHHFTCMWCETLQRCGGEDDRMHDTWLIYKCPLDDDDRQKSQLGEKKKSSTVKSSIQGGVNSLLHHIQHIFKNNLNITYDNDILKSKMKDVNFTFVDHTLNSSSLLKTSDSLISTHQKGEIKKGLIISSIVLGIVIVMLCIYLGIHAYQHPNSKAGLWLIKNRPMRFHSWIENRRRTNAIQLFGQRVKQATGQTTNERYGVNMERF